MDRNPMAAPAGRRGYGGEEGHKWTWWMRMVIKVRPVPLSQLLAGLYFMQHDETPINSTGSSR